MNLDLSRFIPREIQAIPQCHLGIAMHLTRLRDIATWLMHLPPLHELSLPTTDFTRQPADSLLYWHALPRPKI